jgi:2-polyprenyl-6-methoxyphenol hydroxylase-like FAD-dependent oxidoreductase
MQAAAVLADELSRAGPAGVPVALKRYTARVRRVAERHQRESRRFGRVMMVDSRLGADVRDAVLRHVSASHLPSGVIASAVEPG